MKRIKAPSKRVKKGGRYKYQNRNKKEAEQKRRIYFPEIPRDVELEEKKIREAFLDWGI